MTHTKNAWKRSSKNCNTLKKPMTDQELRAKYAEFEADWDPSPQNYGDDYSACPSFDTWLDDWYEEDA